MYIIYIYINLFTTDKRQIAKVSQKNNGITHTKSWKQYAFLIIVTMALWLLMHLGTWCKPSFYISTLYMRTCWQSYIGKEEVIYIYTYIYIYIYIIYVLYIYIYIYNTNQVWVKRRDMYATQSFMLLHSSVIIHIYIFWILSKNKQKENIKYKHKIQLQTSIHTIISFHIA